jgi:hypothetical protein
VNLETPVTTSLSAGGASVVTVQLEATTSTGADATIARRIEALHPSHQALGSLAKPSVKHYFWLGSPPRLLPSIMAKPNPNFGSLTSAWLISWVGPSTTRSSFDNFPCFYRTPLEPGSRTSHLDRSTTRVTW